MTGTDVAAREPEELSPYRDWTPEIVVSMEVALKRIERRRDFMDKFLSKIEGALIEIPGNDKKALGKPGAEALLNLYSLSSETYEAKPAVLEFGDGTTEPLFMFWSGCRIWKQTGPGEHDRMLVADARGVCHSREVKYRYRNAQRLCPLCQKATIIKGKAEYGGGWVCFGKKGGCGAKFKDGDPVIENQRTGQELNPEVADLMNTLLQMADKRALVAATRRATGWSDLVTEEYEPDTRVIDPDTGEIRESPKPETPGQTHSASNPEQKQPPDAPSREDMELYIQSAWSGDGAAELAQKAYLKEKYKTEDLAKVPLDALERLYKAWKQQIEEELAGGTS